MNWTKIIYTLIIVILYIPLVFMGANVFFPQYADQNYYEPKMDCWGKYPPYSDKLSSEEQLRRDAETRECQKKLDEERKTFEREKRAYDGWKYVTIVAFNLIVLLLAVFVPLEESVIAGLFLGSVFATFGATVGYFDTRSKLGFAVLVVLFALVVFFINQKKDVLTSWKK